MATNQIYVESTYDEYNNNAFLKEFASDNDSMNMSPSIFKTNDSVMNVVWSVLGSYDVENAMASILSNKCILNPLLVLRNSSGSFDVTRTAPIINSKNKPIVDVEFPVCVTSFDGKGIICFGFKDGTLQMFVGELFSVQNIDTYQIKEQILVSDSVPGQRVSITVGTDRRILILFLNDDDALSGLVTSDYGSTFTEMNIEELLIQTVQTSTLNSFDNQQLTCISMDGEMDNNLFSCKESDAYKVFGNISVLQNVDVSYPGVYFDKNTFGSMYISVLQDKNNSANNSNIIVMRSDNGGLTFFKIRE